MTRSMHLIGTLLGLLAAGSLVGACSDTGGSVDDEFASFGIGKADEPANGFTACELREVLEIVNESTTDLAFLKDEVGVHSQAAEAILAHRLGPDATLGTADDDIFDDLQELDDVSFVGPVAFGDIAAWVGARCVRSTDGRPFITAQTFSGQTGGGWTRDSVELEATMTVAGITGQRLRAILKGTDSRDRTIFNRVRKAKLMEAFSLDFPLDEIPWDSDSHEVRQAMPLMSWTIERDRFDYDDDGERELSLGTDKMDDTYYDTVDYDLLSEGMVLRGRIRWDTDETVRRLLIAAKLDSEVDDNGLKRAAKIDVRTEGGDHVDTLDADVMGGTVPWGGSVKAIEPIRVIYQTLKDAGRLWEVGADTDVLLLDPKVHIRSLRSRYHLNFTSTSTMTSVYNHGLARVASAKDLAQAAIDAGDLDADDQTDAEALVALADAIADHSAILDHARAALTEVDQALSDITYPETFLSGAPADFAALEKRRIIAESADAVLDDFSEKLDDLDRALTGTRGLDGDDLVDMFIAWQKAIDSGLAKYKTPGPFLTAYRGMDGDDTARTEAIRAFNTYAAEQVTAGNDDFEDFTTVDEALWSNLGRHLAFDDLKIAQRQIECAGSTAQAIWFELAREFYVPASYRSYGNFIIDTQDFTEMITQEEWDRLPAADKTPDKDLPAEKVFHSVFVNEVQLELTEVQHYLDRIEELTASAAQAPDDVEVARNLAGAKFVFDEFQRSIQYISEIKGDAILDRLEDEGAPDDIEWVPAKYSKGKTALLILTDKL